MIKVGLLGAGRIAYVHATAITRHPRSALIAVSDNIPANSKKLASDFGCAARTTDDIIGDPDIDTVLIATSTDTHSNLIEKAVDAGKSVLCEKPVDLSLKRARLCQSNTEAADLPIMIGFNRRFDPNFKALKSALDGGEIGKPELLSITSFDPAPPPLSYVKVSGGLFRDMMIHDFDMANFIMGDTPLSIFAHASSIVEPDIGAAGDVDTAVVTLNYADGRIAVIKNSRRAVYGYDQRIELLGSEGLLQAQNMLENTLVKSNTSGVTGAKPTYFFLERYMLAYAAEWDAFVTSLIEGKEMPVTLADGVTSLVMAEAATLSTQSKSPVALEDV